MNIQAKRDISRKKRILQFAEDTGNVSKTCRRFGISREIFYQWKRALEIKGESALINAKPCPQNLKLRTPKPVEDKILYLRKTYHFGAQRISWYLNRYHQIKISSGGVRGVLIRAGLQRLPRNERKRSIPSSFTMYSKQVPGHHLQVDVKFLQFRKNDQIIRRFQYTAIDDATRIRVLKVYPKHTQKNAIDFIDFVLERLPFRVKMVRTDNGHEFQARFHWHVEDLGIQHVYIKKGTPRLNGKVERSHRIDKEEFYQLLHYKDDIDLEKKMNVWENFYNFDRPHGAHKGQTPYEALKAKLEN